MISMAMLHLSRAVVPVVLTSAVQILEIFSEIYSEISSVAEEAVAEEAMAL